MYALISPKKIYQVSLNILEELQTSILITTKQFSLCTERNRFQSSFQRKTQVYSVHHKVDTKCLHPARLQRVHLEEANQKKQGILKSRPTSLMVNSLIYKPHLQKYAWQQYGWPEKHHYIGSLPHRKDHAKKSSETEKQGDTTSLGQLL